MELKSITIKPNGLMEYNLNCYFGQMQVITDGYAFEVFVKGAEYWLPFDKFTCQTYSPRDVTKAIDSYIKTEEETFISDMERYYGNQV